MIKANTISNMLKKIFLLIGFLSYSFSALAHLKVGEPAPSFTIDGYQAGQIMKFSLQDALKKGPVVILFFPAAFSPGCSAEMVAFAEAIEKFKQYHVTIVAISDDALSTLKQFSIKEARGAFPILSDSSAKVIKQYDAEMVPGLKKAARISYFINQQGKIAAVYQNNAAIEHVQKMLLAAKENQ